VETIHQTPALHLARIRQKAIPDAAPGMAEFRPATRHRSITISARARWSVWITHFRGAVRNEKGIYVDNRIDGIRLLICTAIYE